MHYFHNPGVLERTFLTQFGLSVKQEGAIGQFGTGLKYAIATILRGGGQITLQTGSDHYTFSRHHTTVRGQPVEIVTASLNGDQPFDLPFSTTLGKNWKPWMAFRELYSNALDEGGGYATQPQEANTVISVAWNEFDSLDLDTYFLRRPFIGQPFAESCSIRLWDKQDGREGVVFYKGIRIYHHESPFTYELLGPAWQGGLTEDRTLSHTFNLETSAIRALVARSNVIETWKRLEETGAPEIKRMPSPSEEQMTAFAEAVYQGVLQSAEAKTYRQIWIQSQPPKTREPNTGEAAIIRRALEILSHGGVNCQATILIAERPYRGVLGSTDLRQIYLGQETFRLGLREIIKTLLEEWTHLETGAQDETRDMQEALLQNWLITYTHLTGDII